MKTNKISLFFALFCFLIFVFHIHGLAQDTSQSQPVKENVASPQAASGEQPKSTEAATSSINAATPNTSAQTTAQPTEQKPKETTPVAEAKPAAPVASQPVVQVSVTEEKPDTANAGLAENVTLDFKEADIQNVLKIISYKSGVNIVTTPDVIGNVTIRLVDVPWDKALDVVLKTYGFGYQRQGNIILVTKLDNVSKIEAEVPLQTEIFTLKFLDALDAEKILIPLLSPRGKISVLYTRGQKGWKFGTFKIGKDETKGPQMTKETEGPAKAETISIERNAAGEIISKKADFEPSVKSKTLIITDTAVSLDRIRNIIIPAIDKKPKQVLIETRLMEVNRSKLKDIGFDWGTGSGGASGYNTAPTDIGLGTKNKMTIAGRDLASEFTPGAFNPVEGASVFPGTYPYKAGLELLFKKMGGTQFEVILHALEEDSNTNTLSAPRILTLDNQEASILVGYHTPILSSTVAAGDVNQGPTQTQTLDYYQEIGIRLNVVPQVSDEGYINMIIHPSVTSSSSSVTAINVVGSGSNKFTSSIDYPIIDVREAQTQILMKDGETVVLGGLLKDITKKETLGIPFLNKIPYLGHLFNRETTDVSKVDLLIFITARIVKENELTAEEIAQLEKEYGQERVVKTEMVSKKNTNNSNSKNNKKKK